LRRLAQESQLQSGHENSGGQILEIAYTLTMNAPANPMAAPAIAVRYQAIGRNKAATPAASAEMTRTAGTTPGSAGNAPMDPTNMTMLAQAEVAATPARVHLRVSVLKSDVLNS
jgi:hypothetical protein